MNQSFILAPVLLLACAALPARAANIVVPTQHPSIQAGIDAAVDGDVVLVLPGIYTGANNKNLDFGGKAITVRRANNSGPCTIDCQGSGRGFIFQNDETSAAVVEGVTIANGHPTGAAGGGAIRCLLGAAPTFRHCIIRDNVTDSDGGGVAILSSSHPTFLNCHFLSNTASDDAGAVYASGGADPVFVNCVFSGNGASDSGGAVGVVAAGAIFVNCTFTTNEASSGGAIHRESGGSVVEVRNSILWDDLPNELGGFSLDVEYSIVEGGAIGVGILDIDPSFVDADGADNIAGTVDDDLRIASGSPAIDAADNLALALSATTDLAGGPRFRDDPATPDTGPSTAPIVDMGAYEYADCPRDFTGDSNVGFAELTEILLHFGPCPAGPCVWDLNPQGQTDQYVGFADLTGVLIHWGVCD